MTSVVRLTVDDLINGVEVDIENRVEVATGVPLSRGDMITSIDGNTVTNRSELREELSRLSGTSVVEVRFESAAFGGESAQRKHSATEGKSRDEFDIDSDDDTAAGASLGLPRPSLTETPTQVSPMSTPTMNTIRPPADNYDSPIATAAKQRNQIVNAEVRIAAATTSLKPGKCLLLLCDNCNPAFYVEAASATQGTSVMHVDALTRIKSKLRLEEYSLTLTKSLERGVWIYIEHATKSISLLEKLAECIDDVNARGAMHPAARVLLLCEPHPHFPASLLEGCITLRMKVSPVLGGNVLEETMHLGVSRLNVVQGKAGPDVPTVAPAKEKKRVRIATEVKIVDIESSAFLEMSASVAPSAGSQPEPGSLRRIAKYKFGASEKLISLCKAAKNRFAVGTSGGYVVVLDMNGLPMMQYRPHKACIWDVRFSSLYDFATASEDGTSTIFHYDLPTQELEAGSVASFQSDVFALAYAEPWNPQSAVLSGGLSATICVLHSDRSGSSFVGTSTSIQAMASLETRRQVLFGGGNGLTAIVDPETCQIVEVANKHTRKVPAVAATGSVVLTGSFDKTLRVWDARAAMHCSHNLVMADVMTAVAIDGNVMAACSGGSLFVWDIRNLREVLCSRQKAWNGLTRGLQISAEDRIVVTASVDGAARFWSY